MKRVYCNSILIKGSTYHLEEKYYIHLIRVMRLNIGDEVTLFNQKSGQWLSIIKNIKKNVVSAEVIKKISPPMANSKISLLFSPIKYLNSESIIRQSTEIGIMNIFPTSFQRTVIKKINIDKFEHYSVGAAQQCGRTSIPDIRVLEKIENRLELLSNSNVLMFDENLKGSEIKDIKFYDSNKDIIVIIGPEGGFVEEERAFISKNSMSFHNVRMGQSILKSDTAVIAALSLTFHYFS
jgi:16S rRNA (uracil1498-N3)-methyltransferase